MAIGSALSAAMSGLRATQTEIEVVAGNIANADSRGYTRRTVVATPTVANGANAVRATVERALDAGLQGRWNAAVSTSSAADTRAAFLSQLDELFGAPEAATSLQATFGRLGEALRTLAQDPANAAGRSTAVAAASELAARTNALATGIQELRAEADRRIGETVAAANDLLGRVAELNSAIVAARGSGAEPNGLLDERDRVLGELAALIPVEVSTASSGAVTLRTTGGLSLLDPQPERFAFAPSTTVNAETTWSPIAAESRLGTVELVTPGRGRIDLLAQGLVRGGTLGALVELRDTTLVAAADRLDAFAAGLAAALSDRVSEGTPVTAGAASGRDFDLAGLQPGNTLRLEVRVGGAARTISFVGVGNAAALPLDPAAVPGVPPGDDLVGLDLSAGPAGIAAQVQAALGAGFTVSNPVGSTIRVLDDGAAGTTDVAGGTARVTLTALQAGRAELPLFTDGRGTAAFTGAPGRPPQIRGLAERLTLNAAVASDPALLVAWRATPPTEAGDPTRPTLLADRLGNAVANFPAETGAAGVGFAGTVPGYLRHLVSRQGAEVAAADRAREAAGAALENLSAQRDRVSGVSLDTEMARLIQVQTAYAANARVLQAVRDMLDVLNRL